MSFYEKYVECCKIKNIAPTSLSAAEKIGCSKSNISLLGKSGSTPNGDVVAKAAKMLNVSADYLLELINTPHPIDINFTTEQLDFLSKINELNSDGIRAVSAMLDGIISQPIYKKYFNNEKNTKQA